MTAAYICRIPPIEAPTVPLRSSWMGILLYQPRRRKDLYLQTDMMFPNSYYNWTVKANMRLQRFLLFWA